MDEKVLKILGLVTTIVGFGVSLASAWIGEKKTDALIADKVAKEVAKQLNK